MTILRIYRNYLRILRTARTFYNSFDRGKDGLVKVRRDFKYFETKVKERFFIDSLYYLIYL